MLSQAHPTILSVAVPVPIGEPFDYLWSSPAPAPAPGTRVRIPFGRSQRTGIVLAQVPQSRLRAEQLKPVADVLDPVPLLDAELLATLCWAAEYYHHPIGEVLLHALPTALRHGAPLYQARETRWTLSSAGHAAQLLGPPARARQLAQLLAVTATSGPLTSAELGRLGVKSATLRRARDKGWLEAAPDAASPPAAPPQAGPPLTDDQAAVLRAVAEHAPGFASFLLHGVTGSGKTEVYMRLIAEQLEAGRQTLLLVPEIALTPQLVQRLGQRFGAGLALLHSGLSDTERLVAWRRSLEGQARLVVGTRSAVFAPLPQAGLIVVDEEHDPSYKQQTGLRYSARDLAVFRARRLKVPIVLASATPSLESYHNAQVGRYRLLSMPRRIGAGGKPALRTIDLNQHAVEQGLSTPLISAIEQHLAAGDQVLLFLNRRGYAPVLFCPRCHTAEQCRQCDARMTVHTQRGRLQCHHCGAHRPLHWACPDCGGERAAIGAGTQRVTERLQALFPDYTIARLDRDITQRKGVLAGVLDDVEQGRTRILVGTQMLTKGHDFPRVTLVGILNADQGLFGTDFRSAERLAQTLLQVAGRAGRRDTPGEVVVQTHYPDHPLLTCLARQDYAAFAQLALRERRESHWPPFTHLALWQAESNQRAAAFEFLDTIRNLTSRAGSAVRVLGPAPAPMERREGRYRAQLLLECAARGPLHATVRAALAALAKRRRAHGLRWTIDIDPLEF